MIALVLLLIDKTGNLGNSLKVRQLTNNFMPKPRPQYGSALPKLGNVLNVHRHGPMRMPLSWYFQLFFEPE